MAERASKPYNMSSKLHHELQDHFRCYFNRLWVMRMLSQSKHAKHRKWHPIFHGNHNLPTSSGKPSNNEKQRKTHVFLWFLVTQGSVNSTGGAGGPGAPAGLPWAMSHEPLTINNRLSNELFAFIYYRYQIFWYIKSINKGSGRSQKSRNHANRGFRVLP